MDRIIPLRQKPIARLAVSALCAVVISRLVILAVCLFTDTGSGILDELNRWDVWWYNDIVENGYDLLPKFQDYHVNGDVANWAFFPLLPLLLRFLKALFSNGMLPAVMVVNSVFFWAGLTVAGCCIYREKRSMEHAVYFQWIYAFGAYSFYFSVAYTEALFFLFVTLFFCFMRRKNYIAMGLAGAFCSATRNTGVFLVFAVAAYHTECYLREVKKPNPVGWFVNAIRQPRLVLGVLLVPLGLFAYMAFLHFYMGDGLAFMHIQRAWGGTMQNPFKTLLNGITSNGSMNFYFALFALLWLFSIWKLLKHKAWPEMVVSIVFLLIPMSVRLQSMPRYLVGCFLPGYALLLDYKTWSRAQKIVVFIGAFLWGLHCVHGWITGANWLG